MWFMPPEPVPADPPPDPMTAEEREAWLDRVAEEDEPWDLEEWSGPDDELTAEDLAELAELRAAAEADARAAAEAAAWEEVAADELRLILAGHRGSAEAMLGLARCLAARPPR